MHTAFTRLAAAEEAAVDRLTNQLDRPRATVLRSLIQDGLYARGALLDPRHDPLVQAEAKAIRQLDNK
jgi:hypothetical protein